MVDFQILDKIVVFNFRCICIGGCQLCKMEEQKKAIKAQVDEAKEGDFNFITIIQQRDGVPDSTVTVPISGTNAYSLFEKQVKRIGTYGKATDTVSITYHTEKNNHLMCRSHKRIQKKMSLKNSQRKRMYHYHLKNR